MGKIRKTDDIATGRIHKQQQQPDDLLRFSFRHLSVTQKFNYPPAEDAKLYLQTLLERLKDLSSMPVSAFRANKSKSLRNHKHDWKSTSERDGYAHLDEQLQQCEPWQFCLSANPHGRVHGILVDEVFYVVWLDVQHALYP
jgi:hypothetical protein